MFKFIQLAWYGWKVYKYEKAIKACTKARAKIKAKQTKYTTRYEHYNKELK